MDSFIEQEQDCRAKDGDGIPTDAHAPGSHLAQYGARSAAPRKKPSHQERGHRGGIADEGKTRDTKGKQRRGRRKLAQPRETYTSDEEWEQTKKDQEKKQHDPRDNLSAVPGILASCLRVMHDSSFAADWPVTEYESPRIYRAGPTDLGVR